MLQVDLAQKPHQMQSEAAEKSHLAEQKAKNHKRERQLDYYT